MQLAGGAVPRAAVLAGLLLLLGTAPLAAQVHSCVDGGDDDASIVNRFIEAVRNRDKDRLAGIIDFPLRRRYPLPYISRGEFLARYDEIFDDQFTTMIVSADECGRIGWGELQLQSGLVWFNDGGQVIYVDYESEIQSQERNALIEMERRELHESLREYSYPVLEWETSTYRIRIDYTGDAKRHFPYHILALIRLSGIWYPHYMPSEGYRYASWKVERGDIVKSCGLRISERVIPLPFGLS